MVHNLKIEDQPPAEFVEKRPKAEGNSGQTTVTDTQGSKETSSALSRVREAAFRIDEAIRIALSARKPVYL